MKVSREQAAQNRERIIDEAARQFRAHGFDGIGLADLMKKVGLTHGGFYGHFGSKDDLMAEACARAGDATLAAWEKRVTPETKDPLAAVTALYLSPTHRDQPEDGCLMAALGPEVARQAPPVRRAVTERFTAMIDRLAELVPGTSKAARQKKALATFSSMVGALVLSRAIDDPKLSADILQAVAASLSNAKPA